MPTERGFVEALGIGRAGQVETTILHGDGSTALYTVADLDADPERFNERLSKFGILRDAMDRAEPVEIEFPHEDGGRPIDRIRRLTRDVLQRPTQTSVASGLVVGLAIGFETSIGPQGEATDRADVSLLTNSGVENFTIALQSPERGAALAMVDVIREAQKDGSAIAVTYDTQMRRVTRVIRSDIASLGREIEDERFAAFVERITHTPVSNLMLISVTTAPDFQTEGNVVPLIDFTPELRHLAVVRGSPEYDLLEAALRDKLRVELFTSRPSKRDPDDDSGNDNNTGDDVEREPNSDVEAIAGARIPFDDVALTDGQAAAVSASQLPTAAYLVRGTMLLHALCSASRPVWIQVHRHTLDVGPDEDCTEGLPSNDMRPRSLRELDLPYRAEWIGQGCFNHGVYRIQIQTDRDFEVLVDGELICLHYDEKDATAFGHACLDGDHEVRVVFENWRCKANFDMDMYRIR